ncbi:hypothetical protein PM082_020598 [Marasmius tenuissimus]|nr:hypothetical protein PM082_020598 [Marasmius tenuissimus]
MSISPSLIQGIGAGDIIALLGHRELVKIFNVSSAFLFIYDFLLTLGLEVRFIWQARWTFVKILYIVQRYLPFLDSVGLVLYYSFGAGLSPRSCGVLYSLAGCEYTDSRSEASLCRPPHFLLFPHLLRLFTPPLAFTGTFAMGIVMSEALLAIRLWAVWGKTPLSGLLIGLLCISCWIPAIAFGGVFLKSLQFSEFSELTMIVEAAEDTSLYRGCFLTGGKHFVHLVWSMMMAYNIGALIMILIPGLKACKFGGLRGSDLEKAVYCNGIAFYAAIVVVSVINVVASATLAPDMSHLLTSLTRTLHSLFASRVILCIRQAGSQDIVLGELDEE